MKYFAQKNDSIHKMHKFVERHKLWFTEEKRDKIIRPVSFKEIVLVVQNLSANDTPIPDEFTCESTKEIRNK